MISCVQRITFNRQRIDTRCEKCGFAIVPPLRRFALTATADRYKRVVDDTWATIERPTVDQRVVSAANERLGGSERNETCADRVLREFCDPVQAEFAHDVAAMHVYGAVGNMKLVAALLGCLAGSEEGQHLSFSPAQIR